VAQSITVVILTCNEARHIERAIASVRAIAARVVVVDSGSSDATVALARGAGAEVLTHRWTNYARQFQWALDHAGIATEWTMRLDADEIVEADLAAEIAERLPTLPADVTGVNFARKLIWMGRWVRHGGRFPLVLLRLWRTGRGRIEDRWMDEHIVVDGGRTVSFRGGFADWNLNDLTFFTAKHNGYATREAIDVLGRRHRLIAQDEALSARSASRQASTKRWLKERVYNRLPLWMGPLAYFIWRTVFQLGVLDGRSGMMYHVLQGFWYRYLVNAKIAEFQHGLAGCATVDERRERLAAMTGYDLAPAAPELSAPEARSAAIGIGR
jgi:glycosyltransferase involved in cell wall biosynthesis